MLKGTNIMKEINISKNITDLRKKKGITQEQLAVALNISPQAVSKWETNCNYIVYVIQFVILNLFICKLNQQLSIFSKKTIISCFYYIIISYYRK